MGDDERRRSSDREFERLRDDVKSLAADVKGLVSSIKVLDEWRRGHDAYYKRETDLVAESFANVKSDMLGHETRLSKTERVLEKHSVWVAIVSATAIALIIAVAQHVAFAKG